VGGEVVVAGLHFEFSFGAYHGGNLAVSLCALQRRI
jgi:hypothetical protein